MGGILKHIASLCAFTNPSTNSYRRLVPGFEAPVTVGYATSNRSAVIRIPAYAKEPSEKRFELRSPDGTCNPYYAYAAILMAGLDGIKNKIDPHKEGYGPYDVNLYTLSKEEKSQIKMLPKKLGEAVDALELDNKYLTEEGVFPEKLIQIWMDNKRKELDEYNQMPHPWEFSMYYDL
jgi:glutamine synthetase